jgi:hypothetical protein
VSALGASRITQRLRAAGITSVRTETMEYRPWSLSRESHFVGYMVRTGSPDDTAAVVKVFTDDTWWQVADSSGCWVRLVRRTS